MLFDVTMERHPKYVRYCAAGETSFAKFAALVMHISGDIDRYEDDRVLVDLRKVNGRLTTNEQQLLGELVAAKLPMVFKLASVVPVGEISRNSERAANREGLLMRVFDSDTSALAWLLEEVPE